MILSLRSTLFLAMAATASAEVIDPDWMVAMNMEDDTRANSWWMSLQNTGNPGVEYYATDPNYDWVFDPLNVWPSTDPITEVDCIRLEVENGFVKRSWIKTTVNGVPGAGECDIIESFTLLYSTTETPSLRLPEYNHGSTAWLPQEFFQIHEKCLAKIQFSTSRIRYKGKYFKCVFGRAL